MSNRIDKVFMVGLLFLLVLLIKVPRSADPFIYPGEDNNALFSQAARNHLRFGFATTRGGFYLGSTPEAETKDFYLNHPPLLGIVTAGFFSILGESPLVARSVPTTFFVIGLVFLGLLVRKRSDDVTAFWTLLFAGLTPLGAYYGKMLNFEAVVFGYGMFYLWFYLEFSRSTRLLLLFSMLGTLIDFGFPLLVAATVFFGKENVGFKRWYFAVVGCCVGFLLFLLHIYVISGTSGFENIVLRFRERAGLSPDPSGPGSIGAFIIQQAVLYFAYYSFTPVGGLLFVVGLFFVVRDERLRLFCLVLLAWGSLNIFLFRQAAWIHPYWQFYLVPGVSLAVGRVLSGFWNRGVAGKLAALTVVLVVLFQSLEIQRSWYQARPFREVMEFCEKTKKTVTPGVPVRIPEGFSTIHHTRYYLDHPLASPIEGGEN